MTIVEGVVAILLLALGSIAALQLFDTAARTSFRAEESQALSNRLQAELEEVRQLPYDEIALSAAPTGSADENDPRWRVNGSEYAIGTDGSITEPMVIDADEGAVNPGPEPFTVGDISGQIFKFVVAHDDPSCGSACPGTEDLKRVIVAAKVNEAAISFDRAFQEVHADVADPEAVPVDNPGPGGDEEEGAVAEFWLTDTPCSVDPPAREPIEVIEPTDGHPAHNTRGRCADGKQQGPTGNTRGAPDLMFTEAPELDPNYPPDEQPLFDYATDPEAEPLVDPNLDKGLLMPWSSQDSCVLESVLGVVDARRLLDGLLPPLLDPPGELDGILDLATGETNKQLRTHTWLSPTVSSTGGVLTGEATLELWTKRVNGTAPGAEPHPGSICVSLFIRQTVQVIIDLPLLPPFEFPLEVDVPVINTDNVLEPAFFEYSQDPWPADWTEIAVPMEFVGIDSTGAPLDPLVLTPGSQIGMNLMVRRTGTEPGNALEFMYDHPSFESRLQVKTNEIIGF